MTVSRRSVLTHSLRAGAALAAAGSLPGLALAADNKPIRILVGFSAGGGSDVIARTLSDKLKDALGVPVTVENRPGAGGQIAAQALKAATPDGHTLFLTHDHTISILPQVVKNPGFDPVQDFVPVGGIATFVNAFAVSASTPAKTFPEYVAWLKAQHQGKGAVGIPAPASTPEFLTKLIGDKYKLDLVAAPYRGSAPMIADMLGGQIPAGIGSVPDFMENHKAGRLRVVGVLGTQRQAAMPDVPTFDEMGVKGFEDLPYYGIYAPAGTPAKFVSEFSNALAKVLALREVREPLTAMGLTVGHMAPAQLDQRQKAYTRAWTRIIQQSGFQPQ